jgi:hypothetical protein
MENKPPRDIAIDDIVPETNFIGTHSRGNTIQVENSSYLVCCWAK